MWLYPALSCAVICVSGLDILIIFMNNMQHFYLKKLGNHFSSEPLVNILSPRRPASGCGVIQNFPCTRVSLTSYLRHLGVCVCVCSQGFWITSHFQHFFLQMHRDFLITVHMARRMESADDLVVGSKLEKVRIVISEIMPSSLWKSVYVFAALIDGRPLSL
jgi:hypothetical protein